MVWTLLEMLNFALRALVEEVDGRRQVAHRRVSCDRLARLLRTLLTFKRSTLVVTSVARRHRRCAAGGRGLKVEKNDETLPVSQFMISTLRSQVGFAAAVAHARLRLSRLELIGGSGRALPAATRLPRAPSFRRPPSSRRGEALWERVEAGSGSLGVASSESAAGGGRLRACGS